jgi:diguanylate cyclase (GGDEF)-like protein/PAS domain S-box-containing protein
MNNKKAQSMAESKGPGSRGLFARCREWAGRHFTSDCRWNVAIVGFALLLGAAIWIATAERIGYERNETVESVIVQNSNLAIALEEHAVRTFRSASHALAQVAQGHQEAGARHDIASLVRDGAIDHSIFTVIGVADETGLPVHHSLGSPSPARFAGHDFFEIHRRQDNGQFYIGKPFVGPISGEWAIPLSKRINKADGSFGGVAFAGIHPFYFTEFYRQANLGSDSDLTLVGLDGIIRARHAGKYAGGFGEDISNGALMAASPKSPAGSFLGRGRMGAESSLRFYSYRRLAEFPLIVAVGRSQAEALAEFRQRQHYYHAGASLATVFVLLFSAILMAALARQRRTMRILAGSESRIRATFGQAAAGIALSAPDGKIIDANEVFSRVLGYTRAELTGLDMRRLVDPADLPAMLKDRRNIVAGELQSVTREQCYVRKDGSKGWSNRSVSLVRNSEGESEYFITVLQDITEAKRAAEELRESDRRFRHVLSNLQMVSMMLDRAARITYCNEYLLELTGWRREEIIGRNWFELFVPAGKEEVQDMFHALLADTPQARHHKNEILTRSGDRRLIQWNNSVLRSGAGDVIGTASIGEDITDRQRAQAELEFKNAILTTGQETSLDAILVVNEKAHVVSYNRKFIELWGIPEEVARAGNDAELRRLVREQTSDPDGYRARVRYLYEHTGEKSSEEITLKDGRVIDRYSAPMLGSHGQYLGRVWHFRDITERKQAEEGARLSAKAFESIADGIVVTDAGLRIVYVNGAFSRITGYSREEILGKTPRLLQSGRHDASFYAAMWAEVERSGHWRGEIWDRRKNGEVYPGLLSISAVRNGGARITHYVGVSTDISSLKQYEAQLQHQAHHDALTGLANRLLFQGRCRETLSRARRHGHRTAVLFLDLDHFKNINDSLGHDSGDALLQAVANRLAAHVREIDTVARFGGDEFAVLLDAIEDDQGAGTVAQKLIDAFTHPFQIGAHQFYVSASIGISCYPQDGAEAEALFRNADTAMYRAKAEGRNNYQYFSAEMNAQALENLQMSSGLRLALERNEFLLHYQPRLDMTSGKITGAEALIRWRHPELGMISPARFIPIAEENGLIEPIGEWVLKTACRQMRAWQESGLPLERIAVNLSARQFRQPGLLERIAGILEETGLPARHLELELTESMVMRNPEATSDVLSKIKALGIAISIDDFGTGYSSLSQLKRFPIDFLKIDQSFVSGVPADIDDAAIIGAIIAMAKSLKLRLIAEGVETAEQQVFLTSQGCQEGQGYLFSRPVPASELQFLLSAAAGHFKLEPATQVLGADQAGTVMLRF